MKNRVLATIVVIMLFFATFAAIPLVFKANAITLYHLDVYTTPSAVPVPPGTNDYTPGTYVQLNATDPVIIGNTKYVFSYWDIDGAGSYGNPLQWVYMDANHNATAHYNVQYQLTLNANPFTVQGVTDWIWSSATGWVQTNSMFIDANTMGWVGVEGLSSAPPGVYVDPDKWAYLVNFTGDASGYTDWGWIWTSGPTPAINMTGPKTASSQWAFMYTLNVKTDPSPPPPPSVPGTGWFYSGTIQTLNAPEYNPGGGRRYILNYWTVDGITVVGNPINVTMNTNHTAIAYYKRQSFVYLEDNLGNFSGIQDNGKWYDDGVNYTFTAPTPLPVGPGVRYDFRYWDKPGYGWTSTSNPLILSFDASWDGEHLRGRWQTQYYLGLFSSPTVPGYLYPDSDTTGWYDAGATVNLKARDIVQTDANTRYVFIQWRNHLGGTNPNNNITFAFMQPWNVTAEYKLQYLAKWKAMPSSITVPGFPGQTWVDNSTWIWYGAPATDVSTDFVSTTGLSTASHTTKGTQQFRCLYADRLMAQPTTPMRRRFP